MKAHPVIPMAQINKATLNDAEAIASVLRASFAEFESLYTTPTSDQLRERWSEGPVWVAVQNGDIVSTVTAVPKSSGLYVRSMAVLPIARGQGIAGRLLKEVQLFAVNHHHTNLFLSTTPFLKQAIHLYENFGFKRSEEGTQELFGTPLFTMVKRLELYNEQNFSG